MTKKPGIIFCLIFVSAAAVSAQSRVVTNADLASYKTERIAAERELRENYERLGFASPEVIAKREAESREQMFDLSAKLRRDRLDREARRAEAQRVAVPLSVPIFETQQQTDTMIVGGYWYPRYNWRRPFPRQYQQPGYYAGGQFWPTGPRTQPAPMFAPKRKR
jgi:hypothetical protein